MYILIFLVLNFCMLLRGWEVTRTSSGWEIYENKSADTGTLLTCHKAASCLDTMDMADMNCQCDSECDIYGDCCLDAEKNKRQPSVVNNFECVVLNESFYFPKSGIYMKTRCQDEWSDRFVREKCENNTDRAVHHPITTNGSTDVLRLVPVTSNVTSFTYRNYYCAICNDDSINMTFWSLELHNKMEASGGESDTLQTVSVSAVEIQTIDYVIPVVPSSIKHHIRGCFANVITNCAVEWTDLEVEDKCQAYTDYVYPHILTIFRNPHCAICNNVFQQISSENGISRFPGCYHESFIVFLKSVSFPTLLDFHDEEGNIVGYKMCREGELYDPFFKKCRNVICGKDERNYINGECVEIQFKERTLERNLTCPKVVLASNEYEFTSNGSVYVPVYDKMFASEEYYLQGTNVIICAIFSNDLTSKFTEEMAYVTLILLLVSIICLILHLIVFIITPYMRNLPGKCLACLCLSLLVAHSTFIAFQYSSVQSPTCTAIAIILCYSFLASFCWMFIISFDVWHTLKLATSKLRLCLGRQTKRFVIYCVIGWFVPALYMVILLIFEYVFPKSIPEEYVPHFGVYVCWFSYRNALLVFYAAPVALIMLINLIFFSLSTRTIYLSKKFTDEKNEKTRPKASLIDYKLYLRLAVLMGLTWITGLISGTLDLEPLTYIFIVLNSLQGFFIFLAFTFTKKVRKHVRKLLHKEKPSKKMSTACRDSTQTSFLSHSKKTSKTDKVLSQVHERDSFL